MRAAVVLAHSHLASNHPFWPRTSFPQMEEDRYRELKNNDALPSDPAEWELLTPVLAGEKARLLSEGFGDWSRNHFNLFCRASAKYGRTSYEKIAGEIGKTEEEVQRYAEVFWRKGEEVLSDGEWKKVVTAIEKGEKKLEEIARLTKATQEVRMGTARTMRRRRNGECAG